MLNVLRLWLIYPGQKISEAKSMDIIESRIVQIPWFPGSYLREFRSMKSDLHFRAKFALSYEFDWQNTNINFDTGPVALPSRYQYGGRSTYGVNMTKSPVLSPWEMHGGHCANRQHQPHHWSYRWVYRLTHKSQWPTSEADEEKLPLSPLAGAWKQHFPSNRHRRS